MVKTGMRRGGESKELWGRVNTAKNELFENSTFSSAPQLKAAACCTYIGNVFVP